DQAPASIARHWIASILKKRIGFTGLIISHDVEMCSTLMQSSIEEAVVQAILAGTALIEICRDPSLILRAYEAILTEAESSAAFRKRVESSSRRVTESKHRHLSARIPHVASPIQIEKLRESIKKFVGEIQ